MVEGGKTVIASMLKLNRLDCQLLKIKDLYSIHRVVYDLFPGDQRDFLFVDKGGNEYFRKILIVSERAPKQPNFGEIESKHIPDHFFNHEKYAFEITVNATQRDGNTKKIKPVKEKNDLAKWFSKKALRNGFETSDSSLEIGAPNAERFNHSKKGTVTYNKVTIRGKLTVKDRTQFRKTFETGIGRGKAFGFGLLQIMPINN